MPVFLVVILLNVAPPNDTLIAACNDPNVEIVCFYMYLRTDMLAEDGFELEQSDVDAIVLSPLEAFFVQDYAPRGDRKWRRHSRGIAIHDDGVHENQHVFLRGTFCADRQSGEILVQLRQPWFSSFVLDADKTMRIPSGGAVLVRSTRDLTSERSEFLLIRCRMK